ncbi:MAG TPA: hypothetical protein DEP69_02465, partial [Acidimicrobiaceae bacterium]|nr:hypothetical protein [Acidimicrobiaceae bacterium]
MTPPPASDGRAEPPSRPLIGRPLIGLTGRRIEGRDVAGFPKPLQACRLDSFITDYASAVAAAGGVPVLLTPEADVEPLLDRLDGLLLSGGADIDPARYGAAVDPDCGTVEPERDRFELALAAGAREVGLPVLAICRGLQLVNVDAGGTLLQHVPEHVAGDRPPSAEAHEIKLEPGTRLADIYDGAEHRRVNSLHHQVADRIGDDLVVSARSDDGRIEG